MATLDPNKKITVLMRKIYPSLTDREGQCAFWTCLNLTKKEIANRLAISENTVKCHIKSVTLKLDCYSVRDMKTAFVAHLVIHSLLDAHQGMEGDTSAAK